MWYLWFRFRGFLKVKTPQGSRSRRWVECNRCALIVLRLAWRYWRTYLATRNWVISLFHIVRYRIRIWTSRSPGPFEIVLMLGPWFELVPKHVNSSIHHRLCRTMKLFRSPSPLSSSGVGVLAPRGAPKWLCGVHEKCWLSQRHLLVSFYEYWIVP